VTSNPTSAADIFATTRWTVVLAAGPRSTPQADGALDELCRAYWFPLYAYVRRRGHSREDAEDLTQAFFAKLLEKNYLEGLSAERGRFRAFLLAALKHFLGHEWDRARAAKRGGGVVKFPIDWGNADTHFQLASPEPSPDLAYDRDWAVALLEQVLARLQQESIAAGKAALFEELRPFLMHGRGAVPVAGAASALAMSEGALRVAAHRLRRRYRELLREEVAQTLAVPALLEDEMQSLFRAFER
jgi:DNA-directed RNA polymerase specialized sigma24 family protein